MEHEETQIKALSFGRDFLSAGKKSPKEFESLLGYSFLRFILYKQNSITEHNSLLVFLALKLGLMRVFVCV